MILYSVRNVLSGKGYIGKTNYPHARWTQHQQASSPLGEAIRGLGVGNFRFEPMMEFDDDEAIAAEKYMIEACQTRQVQGGYNVGGRKVGFTKRKTAEEFISSLPEEERPSARRAYRLYLDYFTGRPPA